MRKTARGLLILGVAALLVFALLQLRRDEPPVPGGEARPAESHAPRSETGEAVLLAPDSATEPAQHRVAQAGGALEPPCVVGVVQDADGRAVPDALVTVFRPRELLPGIAELGASVGSGRTDAEGRFVASLPLPGAGHLVRARADGHAAAELRAIDVAAEEPTRLALVLLHACTLAGVVRGADGAPLAGAEVAVEPGALLPLLIGSEPEQVVRTDERGVYRAALLSAGEKDLRVRARGHAFAGRAGVVARADAAVEGVDFTLAPERALRGRVTTTDGRPIAGARVDAHAAGEAPAEAGFEPWGEGTSAADGAFVVRGLALGSYVLQVGAPGFLASETDVLEAGAADVRIVLQPLATLSGRVVAAEDGRPLAAFALELVCADTSTVTEHSDPEGRFRVTAPLLAPVLLRATAPGRLPAELGPLDVTSDATLDGIELRLQAGPPVHGSVLDESGVAWVGLRLQLVADTASGLTDAMLPRGAPAEGMATSDAAGAFTFAHVAPGAWRLLPAGTDVAFVSPARILVGGAPETLAPITAVAAGALEGSVRVAAGAPAAGRLVELAGRGASLFALTDEHGRFRIAGLAPGDYTLTLADGASKRERVQVEAGRTATATLAIP